MSDFSVVMRGIEDLIPYARNARTHSDAQVAQIAASMLEFGWTNPILLDGTNGLIAGHGRVLAARKLLDAGHTSLTNLASLRSLPCVELGHLTDAQKRAYILADNQLALAAGWDEDLLASELQGLIDDDSDISLTGFDDGDVTKLLKRLEEPQEGKTDADEAPEAPKHPVTLSGDLWRLGDHVVLCGDATDYAQMILLMGDTRADLVFTDPPYGVAHNRRGKGSQKDWGEIEGDAGSDEGDRTVEDLVRFLKLAFGNMDAMSKAGAPWYVWHAAITAREFATALSEIGKRQSSEIVWVKNAFGGGFGDYRGQHENCSYISGGKASWYGGRSEGTVWNVSRETKYRHPTQKPVELVEKALINSSKPGDVVLDPFGGSGSTLIGCHRLGRHCRTTELEPVYCDVIVTRWQDHTGEQAIHAETGKTFTEMAAERGVTFTVEPAKRGKK